MAWNLDTAKKYLGIDPADTSQDDVVTQVMGDTLSSIETMLGRELLMARTTVRFLFTTASGQIQLPRAPIIEVFTVADAEVPDDMEIHHDVGWICHWSFANQRTLDVDFQGGYDPLPADLERVMWEAFMFIWGQTDQATGGPPADGSGTVIAGGEVTDVTVFDAFKIGYSSTSSSSSDVSGAAADEVLWGWLSPWAPVLSQFRWGPAGVELGMA